MDVVPHGKATFWAPGWEARLCTSRSEHKNLSCILRDSDGGFRGSRCVSTVRRKLSATDLLAMPKTPAKELFPLIDKEKYMMNAPHGIYNVELNDTSTEIAIHLEKDDTALVATPTDPAICYRPPNPSLANTPTSLNKAPCVFSFEDRSANSECENDDHIIINVLQTTSTTSSKTKDGQFSDARRESTPVIFAKRLSSEPPFPNDYGTQLKSIWFGCKMEYLGVSKLFKIELEILGTLFKDIEIPSDAKLLGKVCMLPGNIQKQTLEIVSMEDRMLSRPHIFFCGFTKEDLQKMDIGIKVYLYRRRGLMKRRKMIHEWTIPLHVPSMIESSKAWIKVEWMV